MPKIIRQMFSIFGHLPYICNVKQKQIYIETFLKETKLTKTQTKSRDMKVILKEGFTYRADFLINEEAYTKLLSAAETFGNYNASAMLDLYIESKVHNLKDINNKYILKMLKESTISFRTFFPSNHVNIEIYGAKSLVEVNPCLNGFLERLRDIENQLAREFKLKTGILEFIGGEFDCGDIINKEEE